MKKPTKREILRRIRKCLETMSKDMLLNFLDSLEGRTSKFWSDCATCTLFNKGTPNEPT